MRIVLLGAPGAGKGTQCKRIAGKYSVAHLSSGDILRQERAAGSKLGKKAKEYMDSGALVPDDLIVKMMAKAISKTRSTGFVLDGFPRTVEQARALDETLNESDESIDAIINLQINDDIIAKRMAGRRSCPQCGAVYHIENLKPKVDGKCDNDGAELIQRPDDSYEVVMNRLKTYHRQTVPVVDYYKENGKVYDIDANKNVDAVSSKIFEVLSSFASSEV